LHAICLSINQYSYATAQYFAKVFLYMPFLVKLHNELGDNTLTHSILLNLDPCIRPCFHYIERHQHVLSLDL
jgi:hypothetical protein